MEAQSIFDQRVYAQDTAPNDTRQGNLWVDTSQDPPVTKAADSVGNWNKVTNDNAQTYKGNDIDNNGDGTVDNADTLQGNTPADLTSSSLVSSGVINARAQPAMGVVNTSSDSVELLNGIDGSFIATILSPVPQGEVYIALGNNGSGNFSYKVVKSDV